MSVALVEVVDNDSRKTERAVCVGMSDRAETADVNDTQPLTTDISVLPVMSSH